MQKYAKPDRFCCNSQTVLIFFLTPAFTPLQRAVMSKEPTKVQGGKNSTEEEGALPRRRNLSDITVLSVLC